MSLAGYDVSLGWPAKDDLVAVWGRNPRSRRGRRVARMRGVGVLTVEDAFLRSVHTGRDGEPPQGLIFDRTGVYFDCNQPSDLENILNSNAVDAPDILARAAAASGRMRTLHLTKYCAVDPSLKPPAEDYVLVIDQTFGDASIRYGGADAGTFQRMLKAAKQENPHTRILVKTHPEVRAGHRAGHFGLDVADDQTRLIDRPYSPWVLLAGAAKVYCVSSLMGFEAILAGHRPQVFGRPFYAGWGLSDDRQEMARRRRDLSVDALFAGAMILYPRWYDPFRDELCPLERVLDNLQAQSRAWREDRHGYSALGIRLWKRRHFGRFFAAKGAAFRFVSDDASPTTGRPGLVWAGKETDNIRQVYADHNTPLIRLEDGFLRSNGLGAELVPPLSLVADDLGIYYDPSRESRLERLIAKAASRSATELLGATELLENLRRSGINKYNIGRTADDVDWPQRQKKILVPGQVEDDASILLGAGEINTNLGLLRFVREKNPDAYIVYKPHPDVEAGLRTGVIARADVLGLADKFVKNRHPAELIKACDEVWTMTSLMGFEALLQGKGVTCLGAPFFAGWGLTSDLGPVPKRRQSKVSLAALVQAVLIDYPRYFDPETGLACPPEVVVARLQSGAVPATGLANRSLSKLQGVFASYSWLWR